MIIHDLWDGFTHINSPIVKYWPLLALQFNILNYFHFGKTSEHPGNTTPLYKILDHISSIFGLSVIGYYLYTFNKHNVPSPLSDHFKTPKTIVLYSNWTDRLCRRNSLVASLRIPQRYVRNSWPNCRPNQWCSYRINPSLVCFWKTLYCFVFLSTYEPLGLS